MKTTTKKKPVVEQAPTKLEQQQATEIAWLKESFSMLKNNYEREKNRLDKTIDSLLNVTKCQK